jgi:ABC-type oligopeptide transport system substrate-binding subunit
MSIFVRLFCCHALLSFSLVLAGCGNTNDGPVQVVVIGEADDLTVSGTRLSSAGQLLRAATVEGLVSLDADGEVIPALADRWIVTDDGQSYIFRLRDGEWPDGSELSGDSARRALNEAIRRQRRTALGRDLAVIAEVRAMAGRVVEVRLHAPMPNFLQLLAQPELGLVRGEGAGPMKLTVDDGIGRLEFLPPERRGMPQQEGWEEEVRPVELRVITGSEAIALFDANDVDAVLNGRIEAFPDVETGPLSLGTLRVDPAMGLFGLKIVEDDGILADPLLREALSMAIDRDQLKEIFNLSGWNPSNRLVGTGLPGDIGTIGERWANAQMSDRQAEAARRVAAWRRESGEDEAPELRISMPKGPGADAIYDQVADDLFAIGVRSRRVGISEDADLRLTDEMARYASPVWFMNQFHCSLGNAVCSPEADALVEDAIREANPAARAAILAEAEAELTMANAFIPFGPPIRWALVRGDVGGFVVNRWGFHPLPSMATLPR